MLGFRPWSSLPSQRKHWRNYRMTSPMQLLSNSNTAMNKSKDKSNSVTSNPSKTRLPSYPWSKNSCWLDTSLELIFYVTMRDFSASFAPRSASLNPSESAWALYQAMELRQVVREDPSMMKSNQTAKLLSAQPSTWWSSEVSQIKPHNPVAIDWTRFYICRLLSYIIFDAIDILCSGLVRWFIVPPNQ